MAERERDRLGDVELAAAGARLLDLRTSGEPSATISVSPPTRRTCGRSAAPFTWIFLVFLAGASDRVFVALGISYVGRSGSTA